MQLVSKHIQELVLEDQTELIDKLINSLSISEQLSIHGTLEFSSLEYITRKMGQLTISYSVKEHILWSYYQQLDWSDDMLLKLIQEFRQDNFSALESLVIRAIKNDQVTKEQVNLIFNEFYNKEVERQIYFWSMRNKLRTHQDLNATEIETLVSLRGYDLLEHALDKRLISKLSVDFFKKPVPGEHDRKRKEQLYLKAINYLHS
ncbi:MULTISPECIES: hypothetical protein [unclassified Paenibacillus]|uniref:hypothetical protein n=1 Tax=unclassified Paenibacillus TaxID=185978 RepID=UPI003627155F